jgi:hypothetical protein
MRKKAASRSTPGTSGNSAFLARSINSTMPSMVTPIAISMSIGGKASPMNAPPMEVIDTMRVAGRPRRKSA